MLVYKRHGHSRWVGSCICPHNALRIAASCVGCETTYHTPCAATGRRALPRVLVGGQSWLGPQRAHTVGSVALGPFLNVGPFRMQCYIEALFVGIFEAFVRQSVGGVMTVGSALFSEDEPGLCPWCASDHYHHVWQPQHLLLVLLVVRCHGATPSPCLWHCWPVFAKCRQPFICSMTPPPALAVRGERVRGGGGVGGGL